MRRISYLIAATVTLLSCCMGLITATSLAATAKNNTSNPANNGQALEIAPPVVYLDVNPGQSIKTQIFLRNVSSGDLIVKGQANDFVASGEDGTPKLILDNDTSNDPYSMKSWVSPPASLLLVPKQIKTMNITINVPKNASPGGHYGVIRFTATPPSLEGTGVSLSASLGALLLLTVKGDIKENLSLKELSVNQNGKTGSLFQSGPLNFVERIQNNGNVHEQPTGQVTITNMFGKKIAGLNVNVPPKSILPSSIRKFEEPLDKTVIGNKRLFGRYTAKMSLTYGANRQVLTGSVSFWVIPYKLIIAVIIIIIALFFLLRYILRRYNRYILARAQKAQNKK